MVGMLTREMLLRMLVLGRQSFSFDEVTYPKGDPDAVSISKRDVELLQPQTFINDTIIDFYIKYLKNKIPVNEQHRFHFFNSFFFRKLADSDKNSASACDGRAAFQRVHKWTRNVNLFEKDYVFIPINYNFHWSLIVICHPGEVACLREEIKYSSKVPCILHMDSLKGSHTGLENVFQSYLCEEWKGRHKSMVDDVCSRLLHLQFISPKLPQQENFYDCGLFLLHYVELFLMNAPISFSLFQTMKFSDFETEEAAVSLLDSRTINFLEPEEGRLSRVLNLVSTQPHEDWLLEKVGASNLRDENINLEEDNSVSKEENAYESDDEECAKRRKLVHSGGERLFTMDLFK